jgi:hypothetical protein
MIAPILRPLRSFDMGGGRVIRTAAYPACFRSASYSRKPILNLFRGSAAITEAYLISSVPIDQLLARSWPEILLIDVFLAHWMSSEVNPPDVGHESIKLP